MSPPLPEPFDSDQRPVAIVYRSPIFNASETFVRMQAANLVRYQALVVGRKRIGPLPAALDGRVRIAPRPTDLAAYRPVLVHAHFATDGLVALGLAERLGIPLVTSLRGYDITRSRAALLTSGRLSWMRYGLFRQRLIRRGDLFLAVSDALRRAAIDQGFPPERTLTHYNGVDTARFRPDGPRDPATILHVGRLVEKKGTALLLKALAGMSGRPAFRLDVVGEGPLMAPLKRLAQELGIADRVQFLGARQHDCVVSLMRRATLLAAPSMTARDGDSEGLPNVVVEALATGLPVVASSHGGIAEAVDDGVTGFLVGEGMVEPLGQRIADLLASTELRQGMGAAARALACARFDLANQMARLESYYDALAIPGADGSGGLLKSH